MSYALNLEYGNLDSESKSKQRKRRKKNLSPIFKWTRDEKYIIEEIQKHIPKSFSSYWDAYAGGGALLFNIQSRKAVINVCDEELYNIYRVIRDNVEGLIEELKNHKNEKEHYYEVRDKSSVEMNPVERAARDIYLSKTCFNGFFRKDENGQFDVPFGSYKNSQVTNKIILKGISRYLKEQNVKLISRKFESFADKIEEDSFVYIAPENNFEMQNFSKFQECTRLKFICDRLNSRGVKFLISHSNNELMHDTFRQYEIITVDANKNIRAIGSKRENPKEIIIKNY
ncbi:DNA adenine methylase [Peptoclostridium litorale DSM 5388]|uniref:site-specific DNA-methyltransferase (adenine-specific) n=1 Tax=Peptoclostridium litorale DSM 5388 TaxID=1121324 RepID=A0A069RE06_PEPLI|nr:Dam family site-specific DNA-(adenine-N6)-methyltransferase [Peptoclostridium litorale]KDR94978.1 modification methylase LlaDCHIA [Peptoclostridium litorale DSM 5388]SIN77168.1 DNA adenine methylase [Peptoclostridium litorale DSM 5388]